MMELAELYDIASKVINPISLKKYGCAGHVACALESAEGNVYTGICIDLPCSLGFCAEQAAIADMLKHGETQIKRIAAVDDEGKVLPPCGRCREFMVQVDERNVETVCAVDQKQGMTVGELLPKRWDI